MKLTDLRATLEQHAEFHDDALPGRSSEVHHRVRIVRRRRRAAVAAGVAAAVAVVATGVALPRAGDEPVPAERLFAGMAAPATIEALGYTYAFDRMVTGQGRAVLPRIEADRPMLVTWADEGDGPLRVHESLSGDARWRPSAGGDFADHVVADNGVPAPVRVAGEGAVAIAVYELTGLPDSVGDQALHFPRETLDASLQDAVIGEPGQAEVTLEVEVPDADQPWSLAEACIGAPEDAWVNVAVEGAAGWSQSCTSDVSVSEGVRGGSFPDGLTTRSGRAIPPGERARVRLWVSETEGSDEPLASARGLRLGLAVYYSRLPTTEVAGWPLPDMRASGGHAWRLVDTVEKSGTDARQVGLATTVKSKPRLFLYFSKLDADGEKPGHARLRFDGDGALPEDIMHGTDGGHLAEAGVVWSGSHRARLVLVSGDPARTALGLAVYERVD